MRFSRTRVFLMGAAVALGAAVSFPTFGETNEVRIVRQFGIHYLPLVVMEDQRLVEARAKANGLPDTKVTWAQLSGGATVNDALLAHAVDFSAGGVGPLIVLWDKTRGGKGDIKGVAAVSDVPMTLTTRDPAVKSIEDFTAKDRIALPAVKTSMQAVTLQMAAAKKWGDSEFERLDKLTVSMPHPDAAAALMSGKSEITAHFTAAPYDFQELRDSRIHSVLDSYDVYGGPATLIVLYGTQKFVDENPKLTRSVVEAMGDAMKLIKSDHRKAAEIYLRVTKEKTSVEELVAMLDNPKINFALTPSATFPVAEFLYRIGRIKTQPKSWKDIFFSTIDRGS
ncbi:MAG TPA: ABC transporter substrate-binding protein [Burkholderiales bacterium]|nr:ABC transporter substrate-binding protein [Burkholderiales bacterium]